MITAPIGAAEGKIDARPVRPTSDQTPWDRALALRDQFAAEVRKTLEREKLDAAVFVSPNGAYPPWVHLQAWLPGKSKTALGATSRERAGLVFTIDAKPYHEHDIVITADLARGKTKIKAPQWPHFPIRNVSEWVLYTLDRGPKPTNYRPFGDALVGMITSMIPFAHPPHGNRLMQQYRTSLTGAKVLGWISVVAIFVGGSFVANSADDAMPSVAGILVILAGLAGLIGAAIIVKSLKRSVSVTMQSVLPPRNLVLVDSWHAVVAELGRDFAKVKQRLLTAITDDAGPGVTCQTETYTHQAPNGYEQRDRLVVTRDQGMVHVHVYQFGHDLFVGWYAYLNWAQWGETNPIAVKIHEGQEVEYRDLRPATYLPNQFDLIDLSSLSEFVHRRLEREIKSMMKERDIDQEIDFKVIRGDRDRALDQGRHAPDEKKAGGGAAWSYRSGSAST
jgi:hypothetical protein